MKLRRCLDFISAPFPRQRFYTLLTGPNFGEHLNELSRMGTNLLEDILCFPTGGQKVASQLPNPESRRA
jgi:hypothetical protein